MKRGAVAVGTIGLVLAGQAAAEIKFEIDVSGLITPDSPSAVVQVWAYFDPEQYAFAGALFDVQAGLDAGGFSEPHSVLDADGTYDGDVSFDGDSVGQVIAGQLHFPLGDIFADTANPILVWEVTWSTDDFTPREIELKTLTDKYHLYWDDLGHSKEYVDQGFEEAAGTITVVPGPAAAAVLGLAALGSLRRRR